MNRAITPLPDAIEPSVHALLSRALESSVVSESHRLAHEAWDLAQDADARSRAASGHVHCFYLYRSGKLVEAANFGRELLPLLRTVSLPVHLCEVLRWTGFCACEIGEFATAIEFATESYRIAEELGDLRGRIIAMTMLGGVFERSGDPWQAERIMRNALDLARELNESYPLVMALNNLGAVLIGKFYTMRDSLTEREEAERVLGSILPLTTEAVALAPSLNDPFIATLTHGNLGEVLVHLEEFDRADAMLREVRAEAADRGYRAIEGRVKCSQGELLLARGEFESAVALLDSLRTVDTVLEHVSTQLRLHYALYVAYRSLGQTDNALAELEQFRSIENRRSIDQLRSKSELMVTRFEADETKRRGIEQAYELARQQARRAAALQRLALQDDLTGLPNRRSLEARLARVEAHSHASCGALAMVVVDIDRFKLINDRYGHQVGDRVLAEVAAILRSSFRPYDFIARVGGEEFVIVLEGADVTTAQGLCEALRANLLEHSWAKFAAELFVTASVGIACSPPEPVASLLDLADRAMYRAKESGRNRAVVSAPAA